MGLKEGDCTDENNIGNTDVDELPVDI
jgi:hypothetical protein